MSKLLFALLPALFFLGLSSCASDGCSFEGKWVVKSADLQSATLDSSILSMAEAEYLTMSYEFSKDSVKISTPTQSMNGAWQFDDAKQEITWSALIMGGGQEMKETSHLESCTPGEIVLSQRLPNDASKEELARISLTLQKAESNNQEQKK